MSDQADSSMVKTGATQPGEKQAGARKGRIAKLELDMRLMGMVGAFIAIALTFNFFTDGGSSRRATRST